MTTRCVVVAMLWLSAVIPLGAVEAREEKPVPGGPVTSESTPDSTCGSETHCFDIRTGIPFSYTAHRITALGTVDTTWHADSSGLCFGTTSGLRAHAISDGSGGVIAAWVDGRSGGGEVYASRLGATGELAQGWSEDGVRVAAGSRSQSQVDIATDGAGGAFITWQEYRGGSDADLYLQRLTSSGTRAAGWSASGAALVRVAGEQAEPRLASDGEGGVFALWLDRRSSALTLYLQHVTATGAIAAGWESDGRALTSGAPAGDGRITADGAGGVWIAWQSQEAGEYLLRLLRLGPDGSPTSGWTTSGIVFARSPEPLSAATLRRLASGVLALWQQEGGAGTSLMAQQITLLGQIAPLWPSAGVEVSASSASGDPAIKLEADGGFVVAWAEQAAGGSDILARRYDAAGSPLPAWDPEGLVVCNAFGDQYHPSVRPDGAEASWLRTIRRRRLALTATDTFAP